MSSKRIFAALAAALILLLALPSQAKNEGTVSAQAAVLMEVTTKRVLMYEQAHERLPMASTTKVMTAILAIEHCGLDELVKTPDEAYGVEGSSIYLGNGESLSMEDMLYGLMLRSGNDAAVAIAIHVGGSVEGFVSMMNEKARELGAINTNFVTPNGLPAQEHYTTAYDLALITAYAYQNEDFVRIASSQYHRTSTGDVARSMKNKNKLLWEYEGSLGGKTGFTKAAGKCLVFAAERDGMRLVGVVLNAPDMFNDAKSLLNSGFSSYRMETVAREGDTLAQINVSSGEKYLLEVAAAQDIIIPVSVQGEKLNMAVSLGTNAVAPVQAGEKLGCVHVRSGETDIGEYALIAKHGVKKAGYGHYLKRLASGWTA